VINRVLLICLTTVDDRSWTDCTIPFDRGYVDFHGGPCTPSICGYFTHNASMSKYGGSNNNCVRCEKAVYFVEQQSGPGGMYHKACFSCKECSKRLDSTNLADKDNQIYCKTCYGRLFGPKGSSILNQDTGMEIRYRQRRISPRRLYPKRSQNPAKVSSNQQNHCTRKNRKSICNSMLEPTRALVA
jgi:hypothetical protein